MSSGRPSSSPPSPLPSSPTSPRLRADNNNNNNAPGDGTRRLPPPPPPESSASPSPSPSPSSPALLVLPDDNDNDDDGDERAASPDLPLTMTASTVLLNLPRDATAALATAGRFAKDKVVVRFKPVGSAPPLGQASAAPGGGAGGGGGGGGGANTADVRRKISSTQKFEVVVAFVRRALRVQESESVFLYINSAFAPALDEVVGNLHQCFKDSHDQLNVSYSLTPAFG